MRRAVVCLSSYLFGPDLLIELKKAVHIYMPRSGHIPFVCRTPSDTVEHGPVVSARRAEIWQGAATRDLATLYIVVGIRQHPVRSPPPSTDPILA